MPKTMRHVVIFGTILLILMYFTPTYIARGNPIPVPSPYTTIGTEFQGTQVKFKCANVTLDVYSAYTEGSGIYVIENLANSINKLDVAFIAWDEAINLIGVTVNQTSISYVNSGSGYNFSAEFQITFPPNGTQILRIGWNFTNIESYDEYYVFPEHIQWISYTTGYLINGGNLWGGIPIEWEDVRFNFHTNAFFTSGQNITVLWDPDNRNNKTSIQLPCDSNGLPYFLYHAENINNSISISIQNVPYFKVQDDLAIAIFLIATGAAIGFPLFFVKKVGKSAKILSLHGFSCSILFYIIQIWDFFSWGMIMLTFYGTGVFVLLLRFFLKKRVQNGRIEQNSAIGQ